MKSRLNLPASIAAVGILAFALVFCRKGEEGDVKRISAEAPTSASQKGPLVGRTVTENPRRVGEKVLKPKPEAVKLLTPEEEEKAAASKASTMYKWMIPYCLDHQGNFPPDTSALISAQVGFPTDEAGAWLGGVIDYRGRGLTTSDDGRLLVMRYRIGTRTDKEVRVYVSGSTRVVPADEPIPEDAPPPDEAPR